MERGLAQSAQCTIVQNEHIEGFRVVCLCAAWCGICREYETEFQALQALLPQVQFAWMDIEEHENIVGEVDVQTFPTLLIGRREQALFLGPLLPQIKVLERLLTALQAQPQVAASLPAEAQALWQRVIGQWHFTPQ